jgi:hypothetical protein
LSPTHTCPLDAYTSGRKQKIESNFPFSFSIVLFNSFWNFGFLRNAKDEQIKYTVEKEKKWWIFGEGENRKMQMVEEKWKNQI